MRRVITVLAAALALAALWACAEAAEPVIQETDRVVVRRLNLSETDSQALRRQLKLNVLREEWKDFASDEENLRVSETKRLVCRHDETIDISSSEIVLLDEISGKESVLLQGEGSGDSGFALDVSSVINERYFTYIEGGYGWLGESGIYDLKEMKRYPTRYNGRGWEYFIGVANGTLFYWEGFDEDEEAIDAPALWITDISKLDEDGFLQTVDALKGIGLRLKRLNGCDISRDGKYYVMSDGAEVVIVDLPGREEFFRMEIQGITDICFSGADTIYLTDLHGILCKEIKIK